MKIGYTKNLFPLSLLVFAFLTIAKTVFAFEIDYPKLGNFTLTDSTTLPQLAAYLYNTLVVSSAIISGLAITFGGVYYLISMGLGRFTDEGKEWIKAGVLGLLLTVSSYLIAYTINPNLLNFGMEGLPPISFGNIFNLPNIGNNAPIVSYKEIPVGTITENLLARTMDCYNFDSSGNPIGKKIKTDKNEEVLGPDLINHDRVDCFLKINTAIESKAKIFDELSTKIAKLMEQCPCSGGTGACSDGCPKTSICQYLGSCPLSSSYIGSEDVCKNNCKNIPCKGTGDPCPAGVKNKIENGPIEIGGSSTPENKCTEPEKCISEKREYKGLSEFRTQKTSIIGEIEKTIKFEGKDIKIIDIGNCQSCDEKCAQCNSNDSSCISQRNSCRQNISKCLEEKNKCIQNTKWGKLKLVEQIMYLKEKAEEIKSKIEKDLEQLKSVEDAIGKCYLAKSSIDFLQRIETTSKKDTVILIEKTFSDPETQNKVDISQYCKGFQYSNSDCFHSCQKICPGNTKNDFGLYSNCSSFKCEEIEGATAKANCSESRRKCITDALTKTACTSNSFSNFGECMTNCKGTCQDQCFNKYKNCPDELSKCEENCNNNSKCLLENIDKCVLSVSSLVGCTNTSNCPKACGDDSECLSKCQNASSNEDYLKLCYENSLLCKNCSDQNAGYPECLEKPYSLKDKYSSSYIYENPNYQKCKEAYAFFGGQCVTINRAQNSNRPNTVTCLDCYPEAVKCPSASKCPDCPCSITKEEQQGAGVIEEKVLDNGESILCLNEAPATEVVTNRVCSGECNEYAQNDDPLTFYCKDSWWDDPKEIKNTPLGAEKVCGKENEIPIGKTVDDSEKWAKDLIEKLNEPIKRANDMLEYIKKIGVEKDYCKCDSKCEGGEPVCQTKCKYTQGRDTKGKMVCSCVKTSCLGNTCQKIINLLKGKTADTECSKGIEDKGVRWYFLRIRDQLNQIKNIAIDSGRSDALKELEYSRKQTNSCSTTQNNYGEQMQLLSCQRVQDEILSPIIDKTSEVIVDKTATKSFCYGKELGEKILKTAEPLMDNWFCCEERLVDSINSN